MMCDVTQLSHKLKSSVARLYQHDTQLIVGKAHEQAITTCLSRYLAEESPSWHVDCEYNRDDRDPDDVKRTQDGAAMRPDIIVHKRRTAENVLAIEAKPYWSTADRAEDFARLEHLTSEAFGYLLGVHLELGVTQPSFTWFVDGVQVDDPSA